MSVALHKGLPPSRPLTLQERLVVAVTGSQPSHSIHISAPEMSRIELGRAWTAWCKRISYRKNSSGPLVYTAVVARAADKAGHHLHALLWEFIPHWIAKKAASETGLGPPHQRRLPTVAANAYGLLYQVAYAFGQAESVFGSDHHLRHQRREPGQHRVQHPKLGTLARHCPQLFSALVAAKDRSLSDTALLASFPRSSRYERGV